MANIKEIKYNVIVNTGVIIILTYGIWSTRYAVNEYYHIGSIPAQKHEAQIETITAQQQQVLDLITQVRSDHEKMFKSLGIKDANDFNNVSCLKE